jgi:4-carboxymuconolactone decarboxylase
MDRTSKLAEPRIPPLPPEQWDDAVRGALSPLLPAERSTPEFAGNVLATMVRHQPLTRAYLAFNAHLLLESTLSERQREVVVLRTALMSGSAYLWEHHVPLGLRAGLTDAEVEGIRLGRLDAVEHALLVNAVDELMSTNTLADATWAQLRAHLDERQVLDLIFTIGCYRMLAGAVNALHIQSEHV